MISTFRTMTNGTLEWRGILIQVTLEKQRYVDHLQVRTLDPLRAPLPITETGYRSHFIPKDTIENSGGPETYVSKWLDRAATGKPWSEIEANVRQYALF
jgi:hypothetical protein